MTARSDEFPQTPSEAVLVGGEDISVNLVKRSFSFGESDVFIVLDPVVSHLTTFNEGLDLEDLGVPVCPPPL